MKHFELVSQLDNPQVIVVVASPDDKETIRQQLMVWGKRPGRDFWFFA
jgi:hypothetical protein